MPHALYTDLATSVAAQFVAYASDEPSTTDWEDVTEAWGDDHPTLKSTSVLAEIVDTTRWAVIHRQVFRFPDLSYAEVIWSAPATEYQEQDPDCTWSVVVARDIVTIVYEKPEPPQ